MRWSVLIAALVAGCRGGPAASVSPDAGPAHVQQPAAAASPDAGALLEQTRGAVELQHAGGGWTAAKKGIRITVKDGLRTPLGAEAVISVDGARVTLRDRSELHVTEARPGRLDARVRGRVESDVTAGRGQVALQVEDGGPEARSTGGHFVVTADGQSVAVAATAGTVEVSSAGKRYDVKAGEVVRVEGGIPEQPVAALERVLLTVAWPGEKTNRTTVPVAGKVEAGSRVYVQGQPVEVAPSGEFRTDVRLHDGRQRIAVVTVDPLGRRESKESEVIRDSTPPQVQLKTPWR